MPSIKEIAKEAGVSVGTVSHALTGSAPVSHNLRARVEAAVRRLNYHPNHIARSLKTRRTRTLGIIVPDMTISFYPRIIRGAEDAARKSGYSLIAVNSLEDGGRQKDLLSLLRSQRVEGILLAVAAAPPPVHEISLLIDAGIPVICIDRIPDMGPIDSVAVDDLAAAEMCVNHLIEMGHSRIAIVTGPLSLTNERARLRGWRCALESARIVLEQELIWAGNLRQLEVAAMCRERLAETTKLPDAIFSTNGPTALGVLRALRDSKLRTPEDIAFATFDELTVSDVFSPSITCVLQPAYEIGYKAAEILLSRASRAEGAAPVTIRLPARLAVHASSAGRAGFSKSA